MLNKDEYNQEEYNDYYRQEVEGSELGGGSEKEGNNKIFLLLGLLALGAAGYFGYTSMNSSSDTVSSTSEEEIKVIEPAISTQVQETGTPKSTEQETSTKAVEVKKETETVQEPVVEVKKETKIAQEPIEVTKKTSQQVNTVESVATTVTKTIQQNNNAQMSPEEITKIVTAVMQQMNTTEASTASSSISMEDDSDLMSALSETEIESIDTTEQINLSKANEEKDTTIQNSQVVADTYNKINVQNVSGSDELSQLSEQISSEIDSNEGISSTTVTNNEEDKEYSTDIKKEVVFREKEMRVIVVKKGDTLGKIAKRAYGNVMAYKKIYEANPDVLKRPDRIFIGQRLRIPE